VRVCDFHYILPPERIAQAPLADRAAARMLLLERRTGAFRDSGFRDFSALLRPDDLLVVNNTRVFPARLYGRRSGQRAQRVSPRNPAAREFLQGQVEVLLTKQLSADAREWESLVRPGRKIRVGERLFFGEEGELEAEVIGRGRFGERTLRFTARGDFFAIVERIGHVPLPPYIARPDEPADRSRYQTVYAEPRGSVAAPTAGLHFTPEVLEAIAARGIERTEITLHVGLGTFQPVRVENVEEHKLHAESYSISAEAARKIAAAQRAGRRIVAVGTTTVRTLEFAAALTADGIVQPGRGEADIFIYPGFPFRVVGALLTNFHLPQSTLLMLVAAFAGREHVLAAYNHAVAAGYRFYSYGDCMFIA
jgi:S-adenosylmethionine:tRNA ribosyltransferase-isomerase